MRSNYPAVVEFTATFALHLVVTSLSAISLTIGHERPIALPSIVFIVSALKSSDVVISLENPVDDIRSWARGNSSLLVSITNNAPYASHFAMRALSVGLSVGVIRRVSIADESWPFFLRTDLSDRLLIAAELPSAHRIAAQHLGHAMAHVSDAEIAKLLSKEM